jgi:hypothetical protein
MSALPRTPPPRNLDIYRLVILRQQQQQAIARALGVTPSRVSQVIRKVRSWVNNSVGDWLFPGRDDLRFYVALEIEQIRLFESNHDPHAVRITGPNFTYTRAVSPASPSPSPPAHQTAHHEAHISAPTLNSAPSTLASTLATTPSPETTSPDPHLLNLSYHIARLLTIRKKIPHCERRPSKVPPARRAGLS